MHSFLAAWTTATTSSVSCVRNTCALFSPSWTPPQDEVNMTTFLTSFVANCTGFQSYRDLSISCEVWSTNVSTSQDRSSSVRCVISSRTCHAQKPAFCRPPRSGRTKDKNINKRLAQLRPKTWNSSPSTIRDNSPSVGQFNRRLKTDFFYGADQTANIALTRLPQL